MFDAVPEPFYFTDLLVDNSFSVAVTRAMTSSSLGSLLGHWPVSVRVLDFLIKILCSCSGEWSNHSSHRSLFFFMYLHNVLKVDVSYRANWLHRSSSNLSPDCLMSSVHSKTWWFAFLTSCLKRGMFDRYILSFIL